MRKKALLCTILFSISLTACGRETNELQTKEIAVVRQEIANDMEQLVNGEYNNLTAEKFTPIITDSNEWSALSIVQAKEYSDKQGKELAQEIKDDVKKLQSVFGEDMQEKAVVVSFQVGESEEWYPCTKDFLKEVEAGTYNNQYYKWIKYDTDELGETEIPRYYLWMDWKKQNIMLMNNFVENKYPEYQNDEPIQVDCYYPNMNLEECTDTYTLCDGSKMSISEAVKMVEEWMETVKLDGSQEKATVKRVMVEEMKEGYHQYHINLVSQYNGILFDDLIGTEETEEMNESEQQYDTYYESKQLYLVGNNEIDFFVNYGNGKEIKEIGEKITTSLSLSQALQIVSENIGVAADYKVNSIELAYRVKEQENPEEYYAYPVWEIEAINNIDEKETRFYVNVVNGEIEVDVGTQQLKKE